MDKREASRKILNSEYAPRKGNYYRQLFDYWWTLCCPTNTHFKLREALNKWV
jgi:hypothetical protein